MEYYSKGMPSPLEAKVILSPNLWEPQTKRCEITFSYTDLWYKNNATKKVAEFGEAISSLISWKHEIIWFTDDGKISVWKNSDKEE